MQHNSQPNKRNKVFITFGKARFRASLKSNFVKYINPSYPLEKQEFH